MFSENRDEWILTYLLRWKSPVVELWRGKYDPVGGLPFWTTASREREFVRGSSGLEAVSVMDGQVESRRALDVRHGSS
jgi:hypothetical protein